MLLYVHIPFCRKKCRYCTFVSFEKQETQIERYVGLLLKEAEQRKAEFEGKLDTIFIGGGTPSLLPPEILIKLTDKLLDVFSSEKPDEFTIESNPGTVSGEWISAAVRSGMNRLSIGMQAYQPELLDVLGRIHTYDDVDRTVQTARSAGIGNLNIDLIFGIPGQTLGQWKETLDAALSLKPTHISAYGLIPEENTPLDTDLKSGLLCLPDPVLERTMYDTAISMLSDHGFRQYEVSNFSLPGFECRHNIGYWRQIPYLGLGVSAASMRIISLGKNGMTCRRRSNPCSLSDYEEMVCGSLNPPEDIFVSASESRFETLMLGLRMNVGIDENEFIETHGISIEKAYGEKLRKLEKAGLLSHTGSSWKLTRRGFDIQNSILVELMDD